jgi:putative transposase
MKRREVDLNEAEQQWLYRFTQSGRKNHQEFKRAQILLASDERIGMKDAQIANALGVSEATVYNTRRRYLEEGACGTVLRKTRKDKGMPVKVDGRVEAYILALACSATPNEEPQWTLSMLADEVVDLGLVESISREKVRQVLKKRAPAPSEEAMEHPA